jgi:hypothetical protein
MGAGESLSEAKRCGLRARDTRLDPALPEGRGGQAHLLMNVCGTHPVCPSAATL